MCEGGQLVLLLQRSTLQFLVTQSQPLPLGLPHITVQDVVR